jgi:biotin synthase-like enzyme
MKIEEIQQLKDAVNGLSPEHKEAAKDILMKQLAQIDNLGMMNEETLQKIKAGGVEEVAGKRRRPFNWFDILDSIEV